MVADEKGVGSKLVKALIEAKKKFKPLVKNKVNPHFKSKYADLEAVKDATEEALLSEGLVVVQTMGFDEKDHYGIVTKLRHVSGEEDKSFYPLPGGVKPQELAAAITYGRRNSKCAILDLAAEDDDDGEGAEGRISPPTTVTRQPERQAPAPKATKQNENASTWTGKLIKHESPENGKWKLFADDETEFVTATPEHADVARSCVSKSTVVRIAYTIQASNQRKRIISIEPVTEGGNK